MEKILNKYPSKLHEDWRYYPLNKNIFQDFIKDMEIKENKSIKNDLKGYEKDFGNSAFEQDNNSFSMAAQHFDLENECLVLDNKNYKHSFNFETTDELLTIFKNTHVVVEKDVSAFLTVNLKSTTEVKGIIDSMVKVLIKENASLTVYINGEGNSEHLHFFKYICNIEKNGKLKIFNLQTGECTVRGEYNITLSGDNSSVNFDQVVIESETGFNEVVAKVFHKGMGTVSSLNNLSYVSGESKSVLNGLLKVHKDASESKAYQNAKSFLLSDNANSVSYPQLEIENPDVECSHGAAVLSFDPAQMFYLQSRGLDKKTASEMILKGILDFFYKEMENNKREEFLLKGYKKIEELELWN